MRLPPTSPLFPYTTLFRSPECYAGDRGFYSADNVEHCRQAKVGAVCIPQRGGSKAADQEELERSPAFKEAQRFRDRKSTRLNSSHSSISYAVFCLKKKRKK